MTPYDASRYGTLLDGKYDELYPGDPDETNATVGRLATLANNRPGRSVLELGIGTGRVALALHRLGVRVAGIDASSSMIAQLRAKPQSHDVEVTLGDYRDTQIDDTFAVVALLNNGIFDPRGIDAQIDIFRNAARHLEPGGCFVVESFVLSDARRSGEWWIDPRYVTADHVELQFGRYNATNNKVERTLVHLRPEGIHFLSVKDTYAGPRELDLLGRLAGFELLARFAGWNEEPYTPVSPRHVSAYMLRHHR